MQSNSTITTTCSSISSSSSSSSNIFVVITTMQLSIQPASLKGFRRPFNSVIVKQSAAYSDMKCFHLRFMYFRKSIKEDEFYGKLLPLLSLDFRT